MVSMRFRVLRKTIRSDFAIIDSMFPQKEPFGFRNTEINEYLNNIKGANAYAMYPMQPWGDAWFPWSYGVERSAYDNNLRGYLEHYPENMDKVHRLDEDKNYRFKLAYSYFLAETYVLLPFYEHNKIPFVFMLYPGGTFGLDNDSSDKMLKAIFNSSCFRGVIVSQQLTKDYLLQKRLCPEVKIDLVFGGFSQFKKSDVKPKKYYKKDKQTFDIVFVAGNYSKQGKDKGYDLFVNVAKELVKTCADIRFHVVGNFTDKDLPLGNAKDFFTFYGYQKPDFLANLYASMDVYLSPNRPGVLYKGNFDGFPLGIDTSYCGVAQFASNPLGINQELFRDGENIVIIPLNSKKITEKILYYHASPDKLYKLSEIGKRTAQELFDSDFQTEARIKIFNKYLKSEIF